MNALRTLAATAFVATLAAAAPLAAHASLIENGSFEANTLKAGQWTVLPSLDGWQADATSGVELRNATAGTAHTGANFVELDTNRGQFGKSTFDSSTNSSIWQTVDTTAGQVYDLSWFYSARAGVAAPSSDIEVYWNDTLVAANTGSGVGKSDHVWMQYVFQVTGTGSDKLSFMAGGAANTVGGSLDTVSLIAVVPEPGTYALLVAGLAALGLASHRRAR
jgi:PEP-CTERM motif